MRITGGTHRGRVLTSPEGQAIRPTSDKVRLAVFNMLEVRGLVRDARVLDLFCGTGALGLESLSRGAASALFIDDSPVALNLARQNGVKLKLDSQCRFLQMDATKLTKEKERFSLVFMDPPYRKGLVAHALKTLVQHDQLENNALIVSETEADLELSLDPGFEMLQRKTYGDTAVVILRRSGS